MICLGCGGARHDDKVETGQLSLMQSKGLSADALDPVAVCGFPHLPLGDGQAQPREVASIGARHDAEVVIGGPGGFREDLLVILGLGKSQRAREAERRRQDRQTVSRLRPLARRALMTRRPPRVFIRARKPWVRTRLILLG